MSKRIFLSDFDGTLVYRDILDVVCGIVGKEKESKKLNEEFISGKREGLPTLKKRIDFLKGVSFKDIKSLLDKNSYLIDGAIELFSYLRANNFITVLHSGNILPVLKYYQNLLGIDHIVGTLPRMDGDIIIGIELSDFKGKNFKVDGCKKIIERYNVEKDSVIAIGDSPSDLGVFSLAKTKIVINPKGGIEKYADFIVEKDLNEVIKFLENKF